MRHLLLALLFLLGVFSVFYFSWLPQPKMSMYSPVPDWIANWADTYYNVRTAIPFLFLGLTGGVWLAETRRPRSWWFMLWLSLVALVILVEAGQLYVPRRNFDWRDIAWGALGAGGGLAIVSVLKLLLNFRKKSLF